MAETKIDLNAVGREIYDLLASKTTRWKKRAQRKEVVVKPDHMYSPGEVAAVLSVSYNTATRIMERMKRTANFAKPRARKRLLRIQGSDLKDYIRGKLEK